MVTNTVQNLKSVLKLYLETIGGGQRDGWTHTHQTKRGISHNISQLTKPSAELRTDKRESWHGLGEMEKRQRFREMGNMWQILKDKGIEKAKRNC